ncbi:hypothetical protein [Rhodopseudomonas telluris]|uniref:Uncharacterized protein n=1 Tax=Rhodopseudomonas telluris TaxID=644215 RepID=A0ABV6EZJ8_9BRAD
MLTPHRQTPNCRRELMERAIALVRERLGSRIICTRCGATRQTMEDRCKADLGASCEGGRVYDNEFSRARREVGLT